MFSIRLTNQKLGQHLVNLTNFFLQEKILNIAQKIAKEYNNQDNLIKNFHPASDEYLYEALKLSPQEFGFPRKVSGLSALRGYQNQTNISFEEYNKIGKKIATFLGAPKNAVAMLYPENGYMGWHHNGNAPGYNILLTYNTTGNGSFDYWTREKNEIIEMKDAVGWSVKVGRFPGYKDGVDKLFWHRARTQSPRITIAWIIDQKDLWIDMIKEISDNDFDQKILEHK